MKKYTFILLSLLSPVGVLLGYSSENYDSGQAGMGILFFLLALYVVIIVFMVVVNWRVFVKAGEPGWASIVPIYNMIVFLRIVRWPLWWLIFLFIPIVNFVFIAIVMYRLALSFGKSESFAVGMVFLYPIFMAIIAFDKSVYTYNNDTFQGVQITIPPNSPDLLI